MIQKILLSSLVCLSLLNTRSIAQTPNIPNGIVFQAVATDPNGNPAGGRTIYIKDAIIQSSATGSSVYSESFTVTSSSNGIFTITIGTGTYLSGVTNFSNIDWSQGPYFLNIKAAIAPSIPLANWSPNSQYVDMGTTQFWAVPFALYASNVSGLNLKLSYTDSTNMLKPYLRKSDSTGMLSNRLKISDTTNMLSPYLKASNVAGKVNYTDTSLILIAYLQNAKGLKYTDTTSMLNVYLQNAKGVKYIDTANTLSGYVRKGFPILYADSAKC